MLKKLSGVSDVAIFETAELNAVVNYKTIPDTRRAMTFFE